MKKYFSVAVILASFLQALSQPSTSHVIDSLKNRSLTLNGVERVDCLDLLALTIFRSRMSFSEDPLNKDKDRADSVYKYASRAFEEAKKIDYRKGTEEILDEHHFVRVHRSYLVNLNEIERYQKGEGGYLVMSDGTTVDVARNKKETLLKKLLPHKQ